ncbi:MAG: hypothetical protein Q4B65_01660 [Candidatus Saccharibacteria bacterium]|nr:hypothetical protein [Candidatus Saccharibacteria bacterium]
MTNQTIDNDLQKAIDDITKITNNDPIFADPVAAAPAPQPAMQNPAPAVPRIPERPVAPVMPAVPAPAPVAPAPVPAPVTEEEPELEPKLDEEEIKAPEELTEELTLTEEETLDESSLDDKSLEEPKKDVEPFVEDSDETLDAKGVKEAALRDLAPILGKLDLAPEKKFDIYKNVIENYNDSSVLGAAYQAAGKIEDEKERAEALLYLVESIDKM